MPEQKLFIAESNDPRRCQGPGDRGEGQCVWLSIEGVDLEGKPFTRCAKHGGQTQKTAQEKKKYHSYLLGQWQAKVDAFSADEKITNLHGELGIMRLQIENIMTQCEDAHGLMMYSGKVSELIMKADKLVNSIDKINNRTGNLLNKSAALALAGSIIDIIGAEVDDPVKIERISNGIIGLVAKMAGKEMDDE